VTRVEGDLFDPAALNRAVEGMAAVIHLAAVFHSELLSNSKLTSGGPSTARKPWSILIAHGAQFVCKPWCDRASQDVYGVAKNHLLR